MAKVSNRKIQWIIHSFFVMLCCNLQAQAQYGGGTGEPNDPYLIYTAEHLNAIGIESNDWDKHFKLMADIDLSDYNYNKALIAPDDNFNKWSYQEIPFTGLFNGNGYTISHLTFKGVDCLGLFGRMKSPGKVMNLGVTDVNITTSSGSYVGGLVGNGSGNVINCYSTGSISGKKHVGGLVGNNPHGRLLNCHSTVEVNGNECVGGLVGKNDAGVVTACHSAGAVNGDQFVGGLVGNNDGQISNCYSISAVKGKSNIGGLVGVNRGNIIMTYSSGVVKGEEDIGGLVGKNYGIDNVTLNYWDIETSGLLRSDGGIGKTTAEMQTAHTFLEAGWDFVDETANGTDDFWWILKGQDYPKLVRNLSAFSPHPRDGATRLQNTMTLSWKPGYHATMHQVYFGSNKNAVTNATRSSPEYKGSRILGSESYDPGELQYLTTYYWRVDEVNDQDPNNPIKGIIWSFTTDCFFVTLDDFEDYNSYPAENRIWRSWKDGLGYGQPDTSPYSPSNGTGSVIGNDTTPSYTEEAIVRSGLQSMPYLYDNNKPGYLYKYSETEKTLSYPRNWTEGEVTELSLWFRGSLPNDPELMYVAITNKAGTPAVIYHDDPNAVRIDTWTEWIIPLQSFIDQGIDLIDVDRIAIGFGTRGNLTVPGGQGKVYFDDIRLYPSSLESNSK